jgi:ADP-L-glycero-D-manno-heptose 6-epimerase
VRVVVTGAAGMIGSNLLLGLNAAGVDDIIAVDDLTDGHKYANLKDALFADYFDRSEFYGRFTRGDFPRIDAVLHQGACSDTMEHDGRLMMAQNYRCTKDLLDACQRQGTRLIYASSAAVYGGSSRCRETPDDEAPMNVYGYSKLLTDQVVRRGLPQASTQVVALRYFNVYGPREQHKGCMASVAFHHFQQFRSEGQVRLFADYGGFGPGEHCRDFVHVDDVVAANLWFLSHGSASGIFNIGTGRAQSFNGVAEAVVNTCRELAGNAAMPLPELVRQGLIQYIDFPPSLVGRYQCFTQADLTALRSAGCDLAFTDAAKGVRRYVRWMAGQP